MSTLKTKKPKKSKKTNRIKSPSTATTGPIAATESADDKVLTCRKCGYTYIPNFAFDFYPDGKDPKVGLCERCVMAEMLAPKPLQVIPVGHDKNVCKFGQGPTTCAFLVMPGGEGLKCAKQSEFEGMIRKRLSEGSISAKGDNCSGPPDFKSN